MRAIPSAFQSTSSYTLGEISDVNVEKQGDSTVLNRAWSSEFCVKMTVSEQQEIRATIKFCVNLGYTAIETYNLLLKAGNAPALKKATVYKWHLRFKNGRKSIEDDERSGRPSRICDDLVTSVKNVVTEDRRRTVREIAEATNTSYGTVRTILHEHLSMTRLCARWVPRLLTTEEQETRVAVSRQFLRRYSRENDDFLDRIITCDETWLWLFDPETKQQSSQWTDISAPSPAKARVTKCGGKYMFIMFADRQGMLLCHAVPQKSTVNSDYYSKVRLYSVYILIKQFFLFSF